MERIYKTARYSTHSIIYNINWCVLYQQKVFDEKKEKYFIETLNDIGKDKGYDVLLIEITNESCISVIVQTAPTVSPTDLVKSLKGISGLRMMKKYPDIKKELEEGCAALGKHLSKVTLWNSSFFIETIGYPDEEEHKKYFEKTKYTRGG